MRDLNDAVKGVTGLTVQQYGPARVKYAARGFDVDNIMYDGLPTSISTYTQDVISAADLAMFDRVEVVRGATGLMQGAGNPAAAINMVRKRPTQDFPRLPARQRRHLGPLSQRGRRFRSAEQRRNPARPRGGRLPERQQFPGPRQQRTRRVLRDRRSRPEPGHHLRHRRLEPERQPQRQLGRPAQPAGRPPPGPQALVLLRRRLVLLGYRHHPPVQRPDPPFPPTVGR